MAELGPLKRPKVGEFGPQVAELGPLERICMILMPILDKRLAVHQTGFLKVI